MGPRLTRLAVGGLACLALACAAEPAAATFPGRNGLVVVDSKTGDGRTGATHSIDAFNVRSGRQRTAYSCNSEPLGSGLNCFLGHSRVDPGGSRVAGARIEGRDFSSYFRQFLFTVNFDGTGFREIAGSDGFFGTVAWSPDGSMVVGEKGGGLWTIPVAGGPARRVVSVGSDPDWSSGGAIAFSNRDLFVVRPGGVPRRVASVAAAPSWSPHSARLAFIRAGNVWTVRPDGSGAIKVTRRGGEAPVWSPDGRRIAFVRNGTVYTVRPTGRGLRRVRRLGNDSYETTVLSDWQALPRRR